MPNVILLKPSWERDSQWSFKECLRDISSAFDTYGVKYEGENAVSVEGNSVRATIMDGYVVLEAINHSEPYMRIMFAQYLEEPSYLESLVAEHQIYKTKAFISKQWHNNISTAERYTNISEKAIETAYNFAYVSDAPRAIINLIKSMRGK